MCSLSFLVSIFITAILAILKSSSGESNSIKFTKECQYDETDFYTLSKSIKEGLSFFENHLKTVVLDGAMGSRNAQAQLSIILQSNRVLPEQITLKLKELEEFSKSVSEQIIERVTTDSYLSTIQKLWTQPLVINVSLWMQPQIEGWKSPEIMKRSEALDFKSEIDDFEGVKSDWCIHQLFSCEKRNITEECHDYMLSSPKYLYTLNHQVIYMLIAKSRNCHAFENFKASIPNGNLDEFLEKLCTKIWFSARRISDHGFFWGVKDLFTEQVALCSMAGFPNFLRKDWLQEILSWRSDHGTGCFIDPGSYTSKQSNSNQSGTNNYKKMLETKELLLRVRKRRSEVRINSDKEHCLLHFTAVGLIVMSVHLRYLIETCYF